MIYYSFKMWILTSGTVFFFLKNHTTLNKNHFSLWFSTIIQYQYHLAIFLLLVCTLNSYKEELNFFSLGLQFLFKWKVFNESFYFSIYLFWILVAVNTTFIRSKFYATPVSTSILPQKAIVLRGLLLLLLCFNKL